MTDTTIEYRLIPLAEGEFAKVIAEWPLILGEHLVAYPVYWSQDRHNNNSEVWVWPAPPSNIEVTVDSAHPDGRKMARFSFK